MKTRMGRYTKSYTIDMVVEEMMIRYHERGTLSYAESTEIIRVFQQQSLAEYIEELTTWSLNCLLNDEMDIFEKRIAGAELIAQLLWSNGAYKRGEELGNIIVSIMSMKKEIVELREQVVINKVNKELEKTA